MLLSCGSHEYYVKATILNNFKDIEKGKTNNTG